MPCARKEHRPAGERGGPRGSRQSLGADAKPGLFRRPPRCTRAAIQASRRVPQTRVGGMSDIILYMHRAARRNPGPVPHGLTPSTRKALSARPDWPCSAEMPRLPPSLASAYPDVSLAGIPHRRWPWQSSAIRLRRLAVIRYLYRRRGSQDMCSAAEKRFDGRSHRRIIHCRQAQTHRIFL